MINELRQWAGVVHLSPESIFVGGGTPTMLRPDLWAHILTALGQAGLLANVKEFTVEANPETVTPELLGALVAGGVNRISIGAQSFQPRLLEALERRHNPESVPRAVETARRAGIDNINLDLIFAIPGQTLESLDADLCATIGLAPTHIAGYNLTYEPGTPLAIKLTHGQVQPVAEKLERSMYAHLMSRLQSAGFEHYEISSWARMDCVPSSALATSSAEQFSVQQDGLTGDGRHRRSKASRFRCEHNLAYWRNANWLGLGPSAASHINGRRWKNKPHLGHYVTASPDPPRVDEERLPPERRDGEILMLGLRLRDGIALDWLRKSIRPGDERIATIDELINLGMLERTPTHLRLTRAGLFVADTVFAKLL